LAAGVCAGQTKKGGAKAAAKGATPRFKAIWEPVPFNKDIELSAITCTGAEICWVAGRNSTILHTTDGGKSWAVQSGGDPEGTGDDLAEIHFVDATHGWVLTDRSRVMGTTDGTNWSELGKAPSTARGIWFLTAQKGVVADHSDSQTQSHLNWTEDGGRTWKRGTACSVDAIVDGLSRKLGCIVRAVQFISPMVGFMGGGAAINMGTNVAAFAKTTDGGTTWATSVIPSTKHQIDSVHFWSEKDGMVLLSSGQTFWTADAGATWTGSATPPEWRSFYGAAGGRMVVGVKEGGNEIGYSFNGGRSFATRRFTLPAEVTAVTFPDATHGYLVGRHGMVYRYRIVPAEYTSQGMLGALAAGE
jgi:photosystem II stability/assembly factor-like uncharacterized protein